jgi:hypothetical protein
MVKTPAGTSAGPVIRRGRTAALRHRCPRERLRQISPFRSRKVDTLEEVPGGPLVARLPFMLFRPKVTLTSLLTRAGTGRSSTAICPALSPAKNRSLRKPTKPAIATGDVRYAALLTAILQSLRKNPKCGALVDWSAAITRALRQGSRARAPSRKRGHGYKSRLTRCCLCREDTCAGLLGETVRRACLVALIGMILTDVAAADIVRHGSIPKAYIGAWAPSASCEPRSGAVVLSAKRYVGAAMKCTVLGVYETPGEHGPIYSARMQCLGPATGARRSTRDLIIVPEGAGQLSLGSDFNNLKSYQRCQSRKPTATQSR